MKKCFIYIIGLEVKKTAFLRGTKEFFVKVFQDGALSESMWQKIAPHRSSSIADERKSWWRMPGGACRCRHFCGTKVRLAKTAQYIAVFRLAAVAPVSGFAGAQPRLAKIAQYIAVFRLAAVAPYLPTV